MKEGLPTVSESCTGAGWLGCHGCCGGGGVGASFRVCVGRRHCCRLFFKACCPLRGWGQTSFKGGSGQRLWRFSDYCILINHFYSGILKIPKLGQPLLKRGIPHLSTPPLPPPPVPLWGSEFHTAVRQLLSRGSLSPPAVGVMAKGFAFAQPPQRGTFVSD